MRLFFTVTKKSLLITLCFTIVLFLTAMWSSSLRLTYIDGSTHYQRMLFIKTLGFAVDENGVSVKETLIPKEFGEVYTRYNTLQKRAGFDLSDFKGKAVTVYNYPMLDEGKILTLIVCDGKIIGGDIAETEIYGEMKALR